MTTEVKFIHTRTRYDDSPGAGPGVFGGDYVVYTADEENLGSWRYVGVAYGKRKGSDVLFFQQKPSEDQYKIIGIRYENLKEAIPVYFCEPCNRNSPKPRCRLCHGTAIRRRI